VAGESVSPLHRMEDHFLQVGAKLFRGAANASLDRISSALSAIPKVRAGARLIGVRGLEPMLVSTGCLGRIAATVLGAGAKPVRAVLFNKSDEANWSLGWHQDRTICVKEKREAPGFGPWTRKVGMTHVAPPFDLLTRMVTARVHLDDVPASNAPLLIAPGSHRLGRVSVSEVEEVVRRCGTFTCTANAGDVWLYATPILHASEAASAPRTRRVLQIDYAAEDLPYDLEWLGI
jgi:hypothetical protein